MLFYLGTKSDTQYTLELSTEVNSCAANLIILLSRFPQSHYLCCGIGPWAYIAVDKKLDKQVPILRELVWIKAKIGC